MRTERREIKKKQATKAGEAKRGEGANEDDDGDSEDLTANPNHITKKLNISDLSAPREPTRRERYVPVPMSYIPALFVLTTPLFLYILCTGSRRRRRRPRSVIGR